MHHILVIQSNQFTSRILGIIYDKQIISLQVILRSFLDILMQTENEAVRIYSAILQIQLWGEVSDKSEKEDGSTERLFQKYDDTTTVKKEDHRKFRVLP